MIGVLACVVLTTVACLLVALNEAERPFRPHRANAPHEEHGPDA